MKSVEDLDLEVLKEFAKLYDNYEVLDFENPSVMQTQEKKFSNNVKAIRNAVPHLLKLSEEVDPTTPSTLITTQVVVKKLVTEERFTEVQLNLKRWQQIGKSVDVDPKILRALSVFTGFKF